MNRDQILNELKRKGKRITQQRRVLIDVILSNPHKSCKEIYYEALKYEPDIGIATVYRMINIMEEIGAINRFYSFPNDIEVSDTDCEQTGVRFADDKFDNMNVKTKTLIYEEIKYILKRKGILSKNNQEFFITIDIK